jgi:predicted esterase
MVRHRRWYALCWYENYHADWNRQKSLSKGEDEDESGILQSRDYFHGLIQQEIKDGISADRIVLGGFSQGGAMSIFSGLTAPVKIGGIVGLSSWLLLNRKFKDYVSESNLNKDTPIFMGHGDRDPLVLYDLAKDSEEALKGLGHGVTFKTYRYASPPPMARPCRIAGLKQLQAAANIYVHVANRRCRGMQHSACIEELDDVEAFLGQRLPPTGN